MDMLFFVEPTSMMEPSDRMRLIRELHGVTDVRNVSAMSGTARSGLAVYATCTNSEDLAAIGYDLARIVSVRESYEFVK